MDTPEILTKAAEVIEERGWWKNAYEQPDGRAVCTMGALCVAVGLAPSAIAINAGDPKIAEVHAAAIRLEEYLALEWGVPSWNDDEAESAEQVTAALRDCAAELSKENA